MRTPEAIKAAARKYAEEVFPELPEFIHLDTYLDHVHTALNERLFDLYEEANLLPTAGEHSPTDA
jgi:hypothetical protein